MAIEVFWASGSPFSWRVLLALEVKRLPYESHLLQFSTRDLEQPAFVAMNPRKQVPVLRDGDEVVYESIAVLAYLDRKFPEPPLFGRTPGEAGRIWQLVCEEMAYLDGPADAYILPLYFGRVDAEAAAIRAAVPRVQAELARLEAALAGREWLAGDRISAADIAVFPTLKSLERASGKPRADEFGLGLLPLAERFPALSRWAARIEALPGYDRTYPPHWRA
jgi:glutathione S-transferase